MVVTGSVDGGDMRRFLYFFVAIVTLVFGLGFAYKNAQMVAVDYYFGLHWEGPLSLILLSTVTLGVVIGFIGSLGIVIRMQRQLVRARREVREVEQEVQNLRALPLKDVL
jgi:putative membrane protein